MELVRIFRELKSKHGDVQQEAARKLHLYLLKHPEEVEKVFEEFCDILNTEKIENKLGCLMAINKILTVSRERSIVHHIHKMMPIMFKQLKNQKNSNELLEKLAECLGNLARAGGTIVAAVVEKDIEDVINWIQDKSSNDSKRYSGTLILREFCKKMQILTFNKLFDSSKLYKVLFPLLKDKMIHIRQTTVECIDECIGLISLRKDALNIGFLEDIFKEVCKAFSESDANF